MYLKEIGILSSKQVEEIFSVRMSMGTDGNLLKLLEEFFQVKNDSSSPNFS